MNKFLNKPLQFKIISVCVFVNVLIFIVNLLLMLGMNAMAVEMEKVYEGNRSLNEIAEALSDVQGSMTGYLSSKTSDSLEEYYRSAQRLQDMAGALDNKVTDHALTRMERNIRNMTGDYLDVVGRTIESKRGRNVEKYRKDYEEATQLYGFLNEYLRSLNQELFVSNSESYSIMARGFRSFEFISFIVMTMVMIGNVIIVTSFVRAMMLPLKKLSDSANEVAAGDFDVTLPEVSYQDEIGIVNNAFSKMLVSIKQYIQRLTESMEKERDMQEKELMMESHLKDAQLKYLRAQINPHFLFNTLNAGAQLAMMEGADRTYEYVQTVADFFRYNIKNQQTEVRIRDEVTLVDNYIQILNVRFSGDIGYEKQVDERLLDMVMPAMILQPIVENAVNHGIREMGSNGVITLKVYREDDKVCIGIGDNGKGISQENIRKILSGNWHNDENQYDNNGIGMDNVISRLRLFAGNDDVIDIRSDGKGLGAEVIIRIPYNRGED